MRSDRRFSQAISEGDGISLIADVGDLATARSAAGQGAEAITVRGEVGDLREVTELPVLWRAVGSPSEAALAGADAWLVTVANAGEDTEWLVRQHAEAIELGLDCVVEVRTEEQLELALELLDPEIFLLTAGDDHDGHFPRRQRSAAGEHIRGAGPHDLGRLDRPGVDRLCPFEQRLHEAGDEIEVDLADVLGEARPLRVVQLVPEAQQVLLPVARQAQEELPHVRRAQVNRYGGRCTPRSVTIALTYSAGVTSKAGL